MPPRRLRGVRAAAAHPHRAGAPAVAGGECAPSGRGRRVPGGAPTRRRHRGPRRPALRARCRAGPRPVRAGRPAHRRADAGQAGAAAVGDRLPRRRSSRCCRVRIPRSFNARSANSRRDLAAVLRDRTAGPDLGPASTRPGHRRRGRADPRAARARSASHPCHGCPDREDHARWAERYWRLRTRDVRAGATGRHPYQLDRPAVRPGLRDPRAAGLPDQRRTAPGHDSRADAAARSTPSWTCWPPSACATACGRA